MTASSISALFPELQEISDASLRTQVINTWSRAIELGGWSKVEEIPFTLMHPTTSTLIDHTRQVTALAMTIGDT